LNAVVNYLEIALERQLDEETKEVITQSHSASKSLVYVIDDLLHLTASGYRPSLPMLHASFELSKCLENTFDQLRHHAVMKDLYFDVSQDSEIAQHVCGDADRFSQALTQLVTNAIKNTKTGGISIHISSHSTSEDFCLVQIGIKDTGVGISERALDELFQEFEQIPDEETNSDEALQEAMQNAGEAEEESRLGLGLALVARYVKQSGGQIRGLSSLGKGSTFTLDIPMRLGRQSAAPSRSGSSTSTVTLIPSKEGSSGSITEPTSIQSVQTESSYSCPDRTRRLSEQSITRDYIEESYTLATPLGPASTVGATVPGAGGTNELSILVADDNTVNLSILKRRLERMGHKVRVSMDGQQCFAIFREFRESVDFILMDINVRTKLRSLTSTYYRRCLLLMAFNQPK
jgi:CheY-like chemotaxis protein